MSFTTIRRIGTIAGFGAKSLICLSLAVQLLFAQAAFAQQAPGIDWRLTDWYPSKPGSGPQTNPDLSGEDWWYDHKNSFSGGNLNGYICAGFSNWPELLLGDETISGGCFKSSFDSHQPICADFESAGNRRGTNLAILSLRDLSGHPVWYQRYNTGDFYRVIQTSDGGYLAIGHTSSTRDPSGAPLYYNPNQTPGFVTDSFNGNGMPCQLGDNAGHAVLVKTDALGNPQWQYLYAMVPYRISGTDNSANAYAKSGMDLWDVIETPSGDFRIVGNAPDPATSYFCNGNTKSVERATMIEVGANGHWHWGSFYGSTTAPTNFAAITRYGSGGNPDYVVSGTELLTNGTVNGVLGCDLWQRAYVMRFNNATTVPPTMIWKTGGFDPDPTHSQRTDDIKINSNNEILFPVIVNCDNCLFAGNHVGNAKVYRLDAATGIAHQPACELGRVHAFDLKLRIQPTSDGGFAAVSSKLSNLPPPTAPNNGCTTFDTSYWNIDAYVGKCNSCDNLEWEKTFDVDNLPAAAAFPGNVKKQECLYSISQAPDGGFVVSGNNSFNFDDYYLAKLFPASPPTTGLYIADTPQDLGLEQNPDNGPMWVSDDIWVRNQNDGLTNTTHQNPIALQTNYVYVRVRNKSCQPAGCATLLVYWAKASTGLSWPVNWENYTVAIPPLGCTPNRLWGDRVTPNPVAIGPVAPNSNTIIAIPWIPPSPNDYSCDGADQGHICLLARVETSTLAPFGMTFPETTSVFTNVKSNSRIAWKNITVVDLFPKQKQRAWSIVRNVSDSPIVTTVSLELPKTEIADSFYRYGVVEVDLGKPLIKKWVSGGMVGSGIRQIDKTSIRILGPDAWIGNIKLDPHEMQPISLLFRLQTQPPARGKNTFAVDLVQTDTTAAPGGASAHVIHRGGVRFSINTSRTAVK